MVRNVDCLDHDTEEDEDLAEDMVEDDDRCWNDRNGECEPAALLRVVCFGVREVLPAFAHRFVTLFVMDTMLDGALCRVFERALRFAGGFATRFLLMLHASIGFVTLEVAVGAFDRTVI